MTAKSENINFFRTVFIVFTLFLILGLEGYYLGKRLSNKNYLPQASTVKWRTYSSPKYGISFKYPQDYQVEERVDGFFVIIAPDDKVPLSGISIDARLQGINENYDKAKDWINTSLAVSRI